MWRSAELKGWEDAQSSVEKKRLSTRRMLRHGIRRVNGPFERWAGL